MSSLATRKYCILVIEEVDLFMYVCTCKCLESCSSPISQTYYLTMQHDNS